MRKKLLTLVPLIVLTLPLAACSKEDTSTNPENGTSEHSFSVDEIEKERETDEVLLSGFEFEPRLTAYDEDTQKAIYRTVRHFMLSASLEEAEEFNRQVYSNKELDFDKLPFMKKMADKHDAELSDVDDYVRTRHSLPRDEAAEEEKANAELQADLEQLEQ